MSLLLQLPWISWEVAVIGTRNSHLSENCHGGAGQEKQMKKRKGVSFTVESLGVPEAKVVLKDKGPV